MFDRVMPGQRLIVAALLTIVAPAPVAAADDDFWEGLEPSTPPQTGGELLFLESPPEAPVLQTHNRLRIDRHSLSSGWVNVAQCYHGLDAVADAQVVYRYREMRALRVESVHNIGSALAEADKVDLSNVGKAASLCVALEARILYPLPGGRYALRNGPFHRRFLDGYFPLHLTLEVDYPPELLRYVATRPAPQPGFTVEATDRRVLIDAWFAGALNTEITFSAAEPADRQ